MIIESFLFVSFVAYLFQIGIFIFSTFMGAEDMYDNKWEYLLMLVPFSCWYFFFKKICINLSEL
jgi:hypothetical protein